MSPLSDLHAFSFFVLPGRSGQHFQDIDDGVDRVDILVFLLISEGKVSVEYNRCRFVVSGRVLPHSFYIQSVKAFYHERTLHFCQMLFLCLLS